MIQLDNSNEFSECSLNLPWGHTPNQGPWLSLILINFYRLFISGLALRLQAPPMTECRPIIIETATRKQQLIARSTCKMTKKPPDRKRRIMINRNLTHRAGVLLLSWLTMCSIALAQSVNYPSKPIKVIVPTGSGGPSDTCMRAVAQAMQNILGQSLVIENVTGATGNIGISKVMSSGADGYTLLVPSAANTSSFVTRPQTSTDLEANFKPIGKICNATQTLVVAPSLGVKTAEEFIHYAKLNPGKISYASIGFGSSQQLVAEMFASAANIEMQHIPFRGESAAAIEISSGRVQLMFMAGAKPFMDSRLVVGLATTNKDTWSPMANLPSLNKTVLPGFTYNGWNGLMAPMGTPDGVIHALSKALSESLKDEKVRSIIGNMGNMPGAGTPEELGEQIRSDMNMFKKIIKERHLEFPD